MSRLLFKTKWLVVIAAFILVLSPSKLDVTVALLRNIGDLLLLSDAMQGEGFCGNAPSQVGVQYLTKALSLQPDAISSWRILIMIKGQMDRQWIIDHLGDSLSLDDGNTSQELINQATITLRPPQYAMREPWSRFRCQATWGAWTIGLVEATRGNWEQATAAYQAGLGLAPGRVPPEIIREYYLALAHFILASGEIPASQRLSAAKYLALANESIEASELFESLRYDENLTLRQRCEAKRGLAWLKADGSKTRSGPYWPVINLDDNECLGQLAPDNALDKTWHPAWVLPQDNDMMGKTLLGFDLDKDILNAGAEVIGVFYWQSSQDEIELQWFRRPNLWPNGGNAWLKLDDFSTCLAGYVEPFWISPCASMSVILDQSKEIPQNPIGLIHILSSEGRDTFIETASLPMGKNETILMGGEWWSQGDFPRAHVSRSYVSGDPPLYHEVLLPLSNLPDDLWQRRVTIAPLLPANYDFSFWLRPEVDLDGEGDLYFDNVFSFSLPR